LACTVHSVSVLFVFFTLYNEATSGLDSIPLCDRICELQRKDEFVIQFQTLQQHSLEETEEILRKRRSQPRFEPRIGRLQPRSFRALANFLDDVISSIILTLDFHGGSLFTIILLLGV
jgi:hypothetical protein